VWNYSAVFIFWWIWGHFYPWQSLPAIAGLWLVHVIVMVICLTDQDSQCWKIKTEQSSKQWYDSDLHSYLTFSSECLNMSHGVCGRYYLRVVILAWRCLSGINYFDKINIFAIFCSIVTLELRVWNYSAVFIFWWIWGHFSPWQSLPVIAGLWLVHVIVMVICLTDQDSQCWKIKRLHSSIEWYDSDLHSYLTFSSEFLNMSHGISSRYCLWGVILAGRHFSRVSYVDR